MFARARSDGTLTNHDLLHGVSSGLSAAVALARVQRQHTTVQIPRCG
jgi:hypothetical protein